MDITAARLLCKDDDALGAGTWDALAGDHNRRTCREIGEMLCDPACLCICVEGPPRSGKTLCTFKAVAACPQECRVHLWTDRVRSAHQQHVPYVGIDAYLSVALDVVVLDDFPALLAEDKGVLQTLQRLITAVTHTRRTRSDTAKRVRYIVNYDPRVLDHRVRNKLHAMGRVVSMHYAGPDETEEFLRGRGVEPAIMSTRGKLIREAAQEGGVSAALRVCASDEWEFRKQAMNPACSAIRFTDVPLSALHAITSTRCVAAMASVDMFCHADLEHALIDECTHSETHLSRRAREMRTRAKKGSSPASQHRGPLKGQ